MNPTKMKSPVLLPRQSPSPLSPIAAILAACFISAAVWIWMENHPWYAISAWEAAHPAPPSEPAPPTLRDEDAISRLPLNNIRHGPAGSPARKQPLIGSHSRLGSATARDLGLTENQFIEASRMIHEFRKDCAKALAERVKEVPAPEGQEAVCYEIPALPDRGAALHRAFLNRLQTSFGPEIATTLYQGVLVDSEDGDHADFGGFGRYDVHVQFERTYPKNITIGPDGQEIFDPRDQRPPSHGVTFEYLDPETGERVLYCQCVLDSFETYLGGVFNLSDLDR